LKRSRPPLTAIKKALEKVEAKPKMSIDTAIKEVIDY